MNANRYLFEEMPVPRALLTLALPTVASQLITILYNMADTFFVGSSNDPYKVAAVSLTFVLVFVINALSNLFGVGGGSLVSRLMGSGQYDEASRASAFSFYGAVLISLLLAVGVHLFMDPLLRALGASDDTLAYAREYSFWVVVVGGVPTTLTLTMAHLLRSDGYANWAALGLGLGGVLNIFLDPLFMFVLLEPGREVAGAGIATASANAAALVFFLLRYYGLRGKTVLTLSPLCVVPKPKSVAQVLSVGLPSTVSSLLACASTMVLNKLCSSYGDIPVASVGLVKRIDMLPMNITMGICQGMIPMVAYQYAAGNYERMKKTIRLAKTAGMCFAALCSAAYLLLSKDIVMLFIREPETVNMGARFLRITCLAVPFMACNVQTGYSFQAMGKGPHALLLACCRQGLFNIPLLFLMNALFSLEGLIWTQLLADGAVMLLSFWLSSRLFQSLSKSAQA